MALGWKGFTGPDDLAYFASSAAKNKKSLMKLKPGSKRATLFRHRWIPYDATPSVWKVDLIKF